VSTAPKIFCRSCASPLVQASGWEQDERSSWHVRLWCPECGFDSHVVLDKAQAGHLSLAIEAGFAQVLEALEESQRFQVRAATDTAS
jgi:hypothetical protein